MGSGDRAEQDGIKETRQHANLLHSTCLTCYQLSSLLSPENATGWQALSSWRGLKAQGSRLKVARASIAPCPRAEVF